MQTTVTLFRIEEDERSSDALAEHSVDSDSICGRPLDALAQIGSELNTLEAGRYEIVLEVEA